MGWKETLGAVGRTVANVAMDAVEEGDRQIIAHDKRIYREMKQNGASDEQLDAYAERIEKEQESYERVKNAKRF